MSDFDAQNQSAQRRAKLNALRATANPYPNNFRRDALAGEIHAHYGHEDNAKLEAADPPIRVRIAGRMMTRRIMGQAAFAHLQDMSGRIQIYLRRDRLPEGRYAEFKEWDLGDILGVTGTVFKTKTGEISVMVEEIRMLAKALHPLPEKFHGLSDQEMRYRQRYLDLIMNEDTRRTFRVRSAAVDFIRRFLQKEGFIEVETPMMQVIPGGAAARPFVTYLHSLELELYLRVAPELYLKRLVVGGIEKVFEINRNFRNEGISVRHNPEFTMLEFYQAYATFEDLMRLTEELFVSLSQEVVGSLQVPYGEHLIDLTSPWRRMTIPEAITFYGGGDEREISTMGGLQAFAK